MTRKITFLLIFILCVCGAKAQEVADTTQQIDIFYSSPKTYELAGVKIVGGGDHYDDVYLAQLAGLSIGMSVQIPGEAITRAVKRLYDQGLFLFDIHLIRWNSYKSCEGNFNRECGCRINTA